MRNRYVSRKLKGKVLSSHVTPAFLYCLETTAMTEKTTGEPAFAIITGQDELQE